MERLARDFDLIFSTLRMWRTDVLMSRAAADVDGQVRIAAFLQGWLDNTPFDEWTEWHPFSRAEVQ